MTENPTRLGPQDWISLFGACDASVMTPQSPQEIREDQFDFDDMRSTSILSAMTDLNATAVFAKDTSGRYIYLNELLCSLLNLSRDDILGRTAGGLFPKELAATIDEYDTRILREGQAYAGKIQLTLQGGVPHVAQITKAPLRNRSGTIIGVIGVVEELAPFTGVPRCWDTLTFLDALFRYCSDGIILTRQKQTVLKASKAMQEVWGMSEAEIVSAGPWALVDRSDIRFTRVMAERDRRGFARGIFRARKKNGALFEVEASTISFSVDGEAGLACWIVRNVSEMRRTEDLNQRWRKMFYGSELGIAVVRISDMTLVEVSPAFALERGYRPEELEGRRVAVLCAPELHATIPKMAERITRYGKYAWESIHVRKDGTRYPVLMNCTALLDAQGRQTHHLVYTLNLSALNRTETMLKAVVEGSLAPMILLGPGGEILLVNNAWSEYTQAVGAEPESISVGANLIEACEEGAREAEANIPQETLAEAARALRKMLRGEMRRFALEYPCVTPQSERWFKAECTTFIIDGLNHAVLIHHEITDRVIAAKRLEAQTKTLTERARELDEMNTALRVLLNQREKERQELHSQVLSNIREMIVPGLEAIRQDPSCSVQARDRANAIIQHFESILSPFNPAQNLAEMGLTPTEARVVSLVRSGLTSKEIAEMLHISPHTVHYYRTKIRKKLDMAGCRQGLRGLLASKPCA